MLIPVELDIEKAKLSIDALNKKMLQHQKSIAMLDKSGYEHSIRMSKNKYAQLMVAEKQLNQYIKSNHDKISSDERKALNNKLDSVRAILDVEKKLSAEKQKQIEIEKKRVERRKFVRDIASTALGTSLGNVVSGSSGILSLIPGVGSAIGGMVSSGFGMVSDLAAMGLERGQNKANIAAQLQLLSPTELSTEKAKAYAKRTSELESKYLMDQGSFGRKVVNFAGSGGEVDKLPMEIFAQIASVNSEAADALMTATANYAAAHKDASAEEIKKYAMLQHAMSKLGNLNITDFAAKMESIVGSMRGKGDAIDKGLQAQALLQVLNLTMGTAEESMGSTRKAMAALGTGGSGSIAESLGFKFEEWQKKTNLEQLTAIREAFVKQGAKPGTEKDFLKSLGIKQEEVQRFFLSYLQVSDEEINQIIKSTDAKKEEANIAKSASTRLDDSSQSFAKMIESFKKGFVDGFEKAFSGFNINLEDIGKRFGKTVGWLIEQLPKIATMLLKLLAGLADKMGMGDLGNELRNIVYEFDPTERDKYIKKNQESRVNIETQKNLSVSPAGAGTTSFGSGWNSLWYMLSGAPGSTNTSNIDTSKPIQTNQPIIIQNAVIQNATGTAKQ
jgi:hypothetical protein